MGQTDTSQSAYYTECPRVYSMMCITWVYLIIIHFGSAVRETIHLLLLCSNTVGSAHNICINYRVRDLFTFNIIWKICPVLVVRIAGDTAYIISKITY